ncbi:MAG: YggS family pyridoxal phosphate-dependent enzyme [Chloroflexota bacterium]
MGKIAEVRGHIARAAEVSGRCPEDVTLIAVTKTVEASRIRAAAAAGLRHFAENRVQEASGKIVALSDLDITWHMVGHLQTNKVKTALRIFDIIHSIDSLRLAETVSRWAENSVPVLIQVNVSGEATKGGFPFEEAAKAAGQIARLPDLELLGLMTIAPLVCDVETIRPLFRRLRQLSRSLGLSELSMGMTDDYGVAVEEGATLVRIGGAIFGQRQSIKEIGRQR